MRNKVAYEIYTSEFRFVRSVDLILQIFLKPLKLPHDVSPVILFLVLTVVDTVLLGRINPIRPRN